MEAEVIITISFEVSFLFKTNNVDSLFTIEYLKLKALSYPIFS